VGTIRFLLAFAVASIHIGKIPIYSGVNAALAVQCFYVISGFLIARVWDQKYSSESNGTQLFYLNRAARIYFMYWAILSLTLASIFAVHVAAGRWPQSLSIAQSAQMIVYQIVSNISLAGSSVMLWLGATPDGHLYLTDNYTTSAVEVWKMMLLPQAWTLELELWFYLLAPFLLKLRTRWLIVVCVASFALRFYWYHVGSEIDPWSYRFFPFEVGVFLLGAIAYRVSSKLSHSHSALPVFVGAALLIGAYLPQFFSEHRFIFLALFAMALPTIFELSKRWTVDRFLADMSFPLYLVHWPIMQMASQLPKSSYWPGMYGTIASVAAAAILVIIVERPIDRWRHSRLRVAPRVC
jgi:peptidoglycan/LPS O-acetylase OafA/YrhL